jgi:SSS family transporter
MSPIVIIAILLGYFALLMSISWFTTRTSSSDNDYFLGSKKSPWYAVAFGMLGDSLSGVTFISVPGAVKDAQFSYFQLVIGYFVGYIVISRILLPLYYKLELTSIYSYLGQRFGVWSERTGAFYFLISRTLGAAARLFLAVGVIQLFVFDALGIPFEFSVAIVIVLMLIYTFKGGIKTLVWTDVLQSSVLLLGVVLSIYAICQQMDLGLTDMVQQVAQSPRNQLFFWDWHEKSFFPKQFFGGMFIAIAMTGLDQNMMQKNLSCPNIADAQKNIRWFSVVMVIVNIFFLCLGALLYQYLQHFHIAMPMNANGKEVTDHVFPMLALNHFGAFGAAVFILGLTAATFSSADSVLTTLTTSFYVDVLHADTSDKWDANKKRWIRRMVHIGFAIVLMLVIFVFKWMNQSAIIDTVLMIAGLTYGPLLGLFAFGILLRRSLMDKWVPVVCLSAPLITYIVAFVGGMKDSFPALYHALVGTDGVWLGGYKFGNELLIFNALLTFAGLCLISKSSTSVRTSNV